METLTAVGAKWMESFWMWLSVAGLKCKESAWLWEVKEKLIVAGAKLSLFFSVVIVTLTAVGAKWMESFWLLLSVAGVKWTESAWLWEVKEKLIVAGAKWMGSFWLWLSVAGVKWTESAWLWEVKEKLIVAGAKWMEPWVVWKKLIPAGTKCRVMSLTRKRLKLNTKKLQSMQIAARISPKNNFP